MTPNEKEWLEEYRRREAAKSAAKHRRALCFWGALFAVWAIIRLFSEPNEKFSFTDSLLLMMIVVQAGTSLRSFIRNRRIAAGEKSIKIGNNGTAE